MSVLTRNFTINRMLANDIAITSIFCKIGKNRVKNVNQNQKYFQGDSCIMRHKGTHTRTLTHTHTV